MGSFDTGETSSVPWREREERPRRETQAARPAPRPTPEPVNEPERAYEPGLKTIVGLGAGLTPDRIVYTVPENVRDGSLRTAVEYLMSDGVAVRPEDRAVAEAVRTRLQGAGFRVVINNVHNIAGSALDQPIEPYLTIKEQRGEDGQIRYNYAEIAVVTQDEGGIPRRPSLEALLPRYTSDIR